MLVGLVKAELRKYLLEIKNYYPDQIVDLIIKYILFIVFFFGFYKNGSNSGDFYIGYLYWMIASYIISEASVSISFEKQVGTIEQLLLQPVPIGIILVIRTLVLFTISIIKFVILLLIIMLTTNISIYVNLPLILIGLISIIGFLGIGLALSGITMMYTKTASFESVISYLLLLLSGTVISYSAMPKVVMCVIEYIPFILEINLSQCIINGAKVNILSMIILLLSNFIMFFIGYFIFEFFYNKVKKLE